MLSLSFQNIKETNDCSEIKELNLDITDVDWFEDIDNEKICSSTPRNKLFTSASTNINEFSNVEIRPDILGAFRVNTPAAENSKNISVDSKFLCESDKTNEKDLNVEQPKVLKYNLLDDIFEKPAKCRDLSNRQDVVNKASLRHMKKYYTNIFKMKNMRLLRTRYCNSKMSCILRAVKKTFKAYFESESLPDYFYYYIIGVLKLKDVSLMNCDNKTIQDVNNFHECCRNYSKFKFETLFNSQSLKILCRNFIFKSNSNNKYQLMLNEIERS